MTGRPGPSRVRRAACRRARHGRRAALPAVALLAALLHAAALPGQAVPRGTVTTDSIRSNALGAWKKFVVWTPPGYDARDTTRRYATVYALHGAWGRETDWVRFGALDRTLDSLVAGGMPAPIVVMPDGDDGWWATWATLVDLPACRREPRDENADTYCVPWGKYDDYVARDLVARVDSAYRTDARREARAVMGLSMGGYGAITLALRYPDVFAAAASHSGVLAPALPADTVPWGEGLKVRALERWYTRLWAPLRLAFATDSVSWTARDPARLLDRALARGVPLPALRADVGTEDPYAPQTRAFRAACAARGVPLAGDDAPGGHAWSVWRAAAARGLPWLVARLAPPAAPR